MYLFSLCNEIQNMKQLSKIKNATLVPLASFSRLWIILPEMVTWTIEIDSKNTGIYNGMLPHITKFKYIIDLAMWK